MAETKPRLLRIPTRHNSVEDLLAVAAKLDLPNAVLLSMHPNGSVTFLTSDISTPDANFMLDVIKGILVGPPMEFVGG